MPDFSQRSKQTEMMDDLGVPVGEMNSTLDELEVINRFLGGVSTSIEGIDKLLPPECHEFTLLDVGCGGGDLPYKIVLYYQKKGVQCHVTALDMNPSMIAYAQKRNPNPHIVYRTADILQSHCPEPFDIVNAALFLHHFPDPQTCRVLRRMWDLSRYGVIINDLHRHPLAFYSISILARLLSRSRLIRHDAPLSVLRAFRKNEMAQLVSEMGVNHFTLHWRWAFRWLLILNKGEKKHAH